MFSKKEFLESVAHEIHICKHLYGKLTPSGMDYRPGEKMRDTVELLRYLTFCGAAPTEALVHDDWSRIGPYQESASTMSGNEFPSRMDEQLKKIEETLGTITDADFERGCTLPWGATTPLGAALINLPLKFLASYRLQLFSYVKATGRPEISTHDAWLGVDTPQS